MADVSNNATVTDSQGFGPRTQIINMAKTNITKAEMQTASTFLQEAGYTITGVAGMLADETADKLKSHYKAVLHMLQTLLTLSALLVRQLQFLQILTNKVSI